MFQCTVGPFWPLSFLFFSFFFFLTHMSVSQNTPTNTHTHTKARTDTQFPALYISGERRVYCELKNGTTECQRETGVVNGLLVAGASWLRVNGSIFESKAEQGEASEPSVSRDSGWGGSEGKSGKKVREEKCR